MAKKPKTKTKTKTKTAPPVPTVDQLVDAAIADPEKFMTQVRSAVKAEAMASRGAYVYGQHEAYWLAFYEYLRKVLGLVEETKPLEPLWELARSCGWLLPYDGICFASERHCEVHLDSENRLHNESGPALAFPDGFKLWYIGGVAVDEQTVMHPETLTVEQINADNNTESQRIKITRFGWPRYLRESGAKTIDSRFNERDLQDECLYVLANGTKRLRCSDPSTGREYALGIPRDIDTCEAAQNWLSFGLDRLVQNRS